ncbi:hypothetical protein Mal15_60460 [Stieleria maiorica]|uniref:Uncharacterized protein n=1 Tax=Stieleria maiorica TaxID=2795974 RepID=A0A5B9MKY1_9BACT|nr:hypothetical protein [Stieleria maiorica]QEG01963.1 hypothetical protein Mal15_60460 [Stieleria maiorica]
MAKYFVQSGTLRTTVQAESSRKAALWAVHQAMLQVLPVDDSDGQSAESKTESAATRGIRVMDQIVRVSELGFDRDDAPALSTMEVVQQWNEMFATLARLQQMLHDGATAA